MAQETELILLLMMIIFTFIAHLIISAIGSRRDGKSRP
jgi:hypothetical protein